MNIAGTATDQTLELPFTKLGAFGSVRETERRYTI